MAWTSTAVALLLLGVAAAEVSIMTVSGTVTWTASAPFKAKALKDDDDHVIVVATECSHTELLGCHPGHQFSGPATKTATPTPPTTTASDLSDLGYQPKLSWLCAVVAVLATLGRGSPGTGGGCPKVLLVVAVALLAAAVGASIDAALAGTWSITFSGVGGANWQEGTFTTSISVDMLDGTVTGSVGSYFGQSVTIAGRVTKSSSTTIPSEWHGSYEDNTGESLVLAANSVNSITVNKVELPTERAVLDKENSFNVKALKYFLSDGTCVGIQRGWESAPSSTKTVLRFSCDETFTQTFKFYEGGCSGACPADVPMASSALQSKLGLTISTLAAAVLRVLL